MPLPRHLLVFRFSSLGDVAMTVPVIRLLLQQHPQLEVTMVSTHFVQPLFASIDRLHFVAADLKGAHKGLAGLRRLYRGLRRTVPFDAVADLHNVLRTQVLRSFCRLAGLPVAVMDKGRAEKKELTRSQNKLLRPLKSTFQRYADVFAALGFPVTLDVANGLSPRPSMPEGVVRLRSAQKKLVAIAPFAQYHEKTYPPQKMQEVVRLLTRHPQLEVLLLGGKADAPQLQQWAEGAGSVRCLAGTLSFAEELAWIAHADVVLSMDSANMHLASLFGVPVVSVWGGTHPYLGFMGWGQSFDNAVQIDLPCRPSSVFGNKDCPNQHACMEGIPPLQVYGKLAERLNLTA